MVRLVEGQIIRDDESAGVGSLFSCAAGEGGSRVVTLFGFRVPLFLAIIIAVLALLIFGLPGLLLFAVALGASLSLHEIFLSWGVAWACSVGFSAVVEVLAETLYRSITIVLLMYRTLYKCTTYYK